METLDSTVPKGNPNASYWPYVIRWGVIIGVIGAVLTLLMYVGGNGLRDAARAGWRRCYGQWGGEGATGHGEAYKGGAAGDRDRLVHFDPPRV